MLAAVYPPTTNPLVAAIRSRVLAIPSWVLVVEIFIGAGWLRASTEKLLAPDWWTGEELTTFLAETESARVPWFGVVADTVVAPNAALVAATVAAIQVLVGTALLTGRGRTVALLAGMTMNVAFVLAGAVTPSAFYLLAQLVVVLWLIETSPERRSLALASGVALAGLALAGSAVLSIRTLHPDHVIDDSAMMLVFVGGLATLGAELARSRRARVSPAAPSTRPVSIS